MKNHYQTLGLKEGASQEAIQEAYDRLYKELDPVNNNNQEFFLEEFEKLQEAYKVLRNSSILTTEKGVQNSNKKQISSTDSSAKNKELILDSKKTNLLILIIKEKKYIGTFILLVLILKILVHYFIFPTEITFLNIDKKVYVQTTMDDRINILEGIGETDKNGNKLIVYGNNFFYYPKELKKVSIEDHINMTFGEKLWLFPCITILLLFIFWIYYESPENDKSNVIKKKIKFSTYFSKINITIFILILLMFYNFFLQKQIEKVNNIVIQSEDKTQEFANKNSLFNGFDDNETQDNMNSTEEYMNNAEEYMNNAEEYMNNAAQSAREAEEFANNR